MNDATILDKLNQMEKRQRKLEAKIDKLVHINTGRETSDDLGKFEEILQEAYQNRRGVPTRRICEIFNISNNNRSAAINKMEEATRRYDKLELADKDKYGNGYRLMHERHTIGGYTSTSKSEEDSGSVSPAAMSFLKGAKE